MFIDQARMIVKKASELWRPLESDVVDAQYRAISKQVPLTYSLLLGNTWLLACQFSNSAPRYLWLYVPIILTAVFLSRSVQWWRTSRKTISTEDARRYLRRTNYLAVAISIIVTLWGHQLLNYSGTNNSSLVAFYLSMCFLGCATFMMHLCSTALTVSAMGVTLFALIFGTTGNPAFKAMTMIFSLVTFATITMHVMNYRGFISTIRAKRQALSLSEENYRLASLDYLTQLPNRRSFFENLGSQFIQASREKQALSIGIVDLDGFKQVNDLFGHTTADDLLKQVSERIAGTCKDRAHVSRLGGAQFALIIPTLGRSELQRLGLQMCESLSSPYSVRGDTVRVTASIGLASYPEHADDEKNLFELANYALHQGKRSGSGIIRMFSADQRAEMLRNAEITRTLHAADLEKEFYMEFQPIVDIRSNRIVALEALARWTSPLLGRVPPNVFIPAAERSGTISKLTQVLLRKALQTASGWPENLRLSFNISAADIRSPETVASLVAIVSESSFDPGRLDFEITETVMVRDVEQASSALGTLRSLGCGVSLDDFGTGFSSLSQLHALPLTKIKVDRSFVTDLHADPTRYKIVKSLLALSRDMELSCVVEGVESNAELHALKSLGCGLVQGYIFSKPLLPGAVTQAISEDFGRDEELQKPARRA